MTAVFDIFTSLEVVWPLEFLESPNRAQPTGKGTGSVIPRDSHSDHALVREHPQQPTNTVRCERHWREPMQDLGSKRERAQSRVGPAKGAGLTRCTVTCTVTFHSKCLESCQSFGGSGDGKDLEEPITTVRRRVPVRESVEEGGLGRESRKRKRVSDTRWCRTVVLKCVERAYIRSGALTGEADLGQRRGHVSLSVGNGQDAHCARGSGGLDATVEPKIACRQIKVRPGPQQRFSVVALSLLESQGSVLAGVPLLSTY